MSTDFSNHLADLFDDVAGTISPRADFAAAQAGAAEMALAPTVPGGRGPFRSGLALVAALLLLVAGAVVVAQRTNGEADSLSTASEVTTAAADPVTVSQADEEGAPTEAAEPATSSDAAAGDATGPSTDTVPSRPVELAIDSTRTADVGEVDFARTPATVSLGGAAPDGEVVSVFSLAGSAETIADDGSWSIMLELTDLADTPDGKLLIEVSFGDAAVSQLVWIERPSIEPQEPKVEPVTAAPKEEPAAPAPKIEEPRAEPAPKTEPAPKPEPASAAFTAALDGAKWNYDPPKVHLSGTGQPGSKVTAGSQYGEQHVEVGKGGYWEIWLKLWGIEPGATANVVVTNRASDAGYQFFATMPIPEPVAVDFSAGSVGGDHSGDPIWHKFSGTAQPGSGVTASSPYGAADLTVGSSGEWLLKLWMNGVPAGSGFNVQVTNTASGEVFEFWIETPAVEPKPEPTVAFTANAVYLTRDSDPPYNDFWGTAQPGSTVKVLSPYGGAEFTVGESGSWEKRVFFEPAPLGETFTIKVKSAATGEYAQFPFTRVAAE